MSIDNTVNELSNTLSELGRLVNHINSQISGITGRINKTLDNFDDSVAKVAGDASSVTGQLTDTVSQVPNSWVFYLLLITLCIVFILLSIVLSLNLVTKMHAIWVIFRGRDTEKMPILDEEEQQQTIPIKSGYGSDPRRPTRLEPRLEPRFEHSTQNDTSVYQAKRAHVALPMEFEPPRRFGAGGNGNPPPGAHEIFPRAQAQSTHEHRRLIGDSPHRDGMTESMLFRPYRTLIECPFDGSSIVRSETPQLARTWPLGGFSHSPRALPESPWILSAQASPLVVSENGFNDSVQAPVAVQRRIGSGNEQPGQLGRQGVYHLDSGTTSYTTRSLKSQEV